MYIIFKGSGFIMQDVATTLKIQRICFHQRETGTFKHVSHERIEKALARLCICADAPEPSLFAHTKYGCS